MSPYRDVDAYIARAQWKQSVLAFVGALGNVVAAAVGFSAGAAAILLIVYAVAASNRPPPCAESVTFIGVGSAQAACEPRARLEITPVAAGHLARCVCPR